MCYCKTNSRRYSHCKDIKNSLPGAFARFYQKDLQSNFTKKKLHYKEEIEKQVDNF